ncbi:6,7-dimethyl-8-ribityllumazine synthase [hydrothermal vent metagenome]|uniref:6,7-dimethyl-8-ribityllumazine synthase n=1 Tax=hydrothermal vent metagenome TaxID=652676 RepID=A0A3B0U0A8_9ZZZZ
MTKDNVAQSSNIRMAVVVSRFNQEVTSGLLAGALAYLDEEGIKVGPGDIVEAPGAFEIPLLAQTLAATGKFDGVVCLGCVVKGETAHFEYISEAASNGLINASLAAGIPFGFGILATYDQDQAIARSGENANNKGREAAAACVQSIMSIRQITK